MTRLLLKPFPIIYFLFFLSGAAGLVYEIIWIRMLVYIFGSTTNSIVATISAFFGGLAIGSLIFGKIADRFSAGKLLMIYALLELSIGITAGSTLILIPLIRTFYSLFSDGSFVSFNLLTIKFTLATLILLVPTILMGATLPILVNFVKSQIKSSGKVVSYLYAVNTFGAVAGVLISAFILIELLGLKSTLLLAAFTNIFIAIIATFIRVSGKIVSDKHQEEIYKGPSQIISKKAATIIIIFSLSGLISIAYEVIWTRILTPIVGTFVYAFAAILALYLLGIALGSFAYKKFSKMIKSKILAFAVCEFAIGAFALGSVFISNQRSLTVFTAILSATIFMGLTFPIVVSIIDQKNQTGKLVGLSYFGNTAGSIIGGFLASFFLIPVIGSSQSIIFLSIFNLSLASILILSDRNLKPVLNFSTSIAILLIIVLTAWLFIFKRESLYPNITQWRINWAKENNIEFVFLEDEIASVFAYRDEKNNDQNLYIDGVPTTGKIIETKLMAHLPIILHKNPEKILVIAFGMGTTYRSSLSYDLDTDAIELVPSVPSLMRFFHKDAAKYLKHPNGRIIINDGRNYISLTQNKYDVVTIDPPPPFNAAGTTVLYSKDFYDDIAKKLEPGGIVSQWVLFGSREDDIAMVTKSFVDVFPYVLVFKTDKFNGMFLEGSFSPFNFKEEDFVIKFKNKINSNYDLQESFKELQSIDILNFYAGDKERLLKWVGEIEPVTDNYPRTEFFLMRHLFKEPEDLLGRSSRKLLQ